MSAGIQRYYTFSPELEDGLVTATCNSSYRADNSKLTIQEMLFLKRTRCYGVAGVTCCPTVGAKVIVSR